MYLSSAPTLTLQLVKDLVEIGCLSFICFRWLRWLQQDKQKPLLFYFYSFCGLILASSVLQLETLLYVLHYCSPLIMTLFVLVHQHTLQKNFIGLYKVKPAQKTAHDWLREIIRFCLHAQTDLYFLIEHSTSFAESVTTEIPLQTPVHHRLLNLIASAPEFNPDHYLLADTQGNLLGINVIWKKPLALTALDEQHIEKATYYLIDSDGCMLHYTQKTRKFTIVIKQKIYPNLSAAQVLQSMAHYLRAAEHSKGITHEARHSSSSFQPSA